MKYSLINHRKYRFSQNKVRLLGFKVHALIATGADVHCINALSFSC